MFFSESRARVAKLCGSRLASGCASAAIAAGRRCTRSSPPGCARTCGTALRARCASCAGASSAAASCSRRAYARRAYARRAYACSPEAASCGRRTDDAVRRRSRSGDPHLTRRGRVASSSRALAAIALDERFRSDIANRSAGAAAGAHTILARLTSLFLFCSGNCVAVLGSGVRLLRATAKQRQRFITRKPTVDTCCRVTCIPRAIVQPMFGCVSLHTKVGRRQSPLCRVLMV